MTPQQVQQIRAKIPTMSVYEKTETLELLDELEKRKERKKAEKEFIRFVKAMWPEFIEGKHHIKMAEAFEKVIEGKVKRLIINMPPRHTKSEFASYLLPAWFLGKYPNKKIIQTSHTAELAVGFGREVRNLVGSDQYKEAFPTVHPGLDSVYNRGVLLLL